MDAARQAQVHKILYECGLLSALSQCGRPHIIGSCRMDLMVGNDLDIDIENESMTTERLYALTAYILNTFHPTWYEAKDEQNAEGSTVWFHGFACFIDGALWNIDLWFLDRKEIERAKAYCDGISEQIRLHPIYRERILTIKEELCTRGLYGYPAYTGMDVYDAVLQKGILDADDFLRRFAK